MSEPRQLRKSSPRKIASNGVQGHPEASEDAGTGQVLKDRPVFVPKGEILYENMRFASMDCDRCGSQFWVSLSSDPDCLHDRDECDRELVSSVMED